VRGVKLLAVLALALTAAGCGLESPFYLNPPGTPAQPASTGTPIFYLLHTSQNNEVEFRGYELYYKLYSLDSDGQALMSAESNLGSATFDVLISKSYHPLCTTLHDTSTTSSVIHNAPLIRILPADIGSTLQFLIDLSPAYQSTLSVPYAGGIIPLNRFVPDGNGSLKSFDPAQIASTDSDISAIWNAATISQHSVDVVLYALSYGVKDLTTPIYSNPVYLGYAQINILP